VAKLVKVLDVDRGSGSLDKMPGDGLAMTGANNNQGYQGKAGLSQRRQVGSELTLEGTFIFSRFLFCSRSPLALR
jgi:hypothetical protein